MKKHFKKIILVILLVSIISIVYILINKIYDKNLKSKINTVSYLRKNVNITENYMLGDNVLSVNKVSDIDIYSENYRKVIDEKINKLTNKTYDFSSPLLIYNPYGTNSSGINIYFNTKEKSYITYKIKVSNSNIKDYVNTPKNDGNNNLTKKHQYQITGLVAGKNQIIEINLYNKDGKKIKTNKINVYIPKSEVDISLSKEKGTSKEKLTNGLYALLGHDKNFNSNIYLYDNDGILRVEVPLNGYRTDRIVMIDNSMFYSYSKNEFAQVDKLGKVINTYKIDGYEMHHDYIYDSSNNKVIILANKNGEDTIEDRVLTLDLNTKEVKEIINMKDFALDFYKTAVKPEGGNTYGGDELDWVHLNSLSLNGTDLILSSREFSTIFCIKDIYNSPTLKYVIGDETIYSGTSLEDYALKKQGSFISQAGQHTITYEFDNTLASNSYYIIMYNNNFASSRTRPNFNWEPFTGAGTYTKGTSSKYYKYLVNENDKTYTLVDSFDTDYSSIVSSVQDIGNNTVTSSGKNNSFSEYDKDHNLIAKFTYNSKKYAYRVFKYDFKSFWSY